MPEVRHLAATNWQHTCPDCGYENGFHVSFRHVTPDPQGNNTAVWFICPSCSALFDIGLRVRIQQEPKP